MYFYKDKYIDLFLKNKKVSFILVLINYYFIVDVIILLNKEVNYVNDCDELKILVFFLRSSCLKNNN